MPSSRSVQEMLNTSLQHAHWLNSQFLAFIELKRRDVLARRASRAWWESTPHATEAAPQEEEADNDWLVV